MYVHYSEAPLYKYHSLIGAPYVCMSITQRLHCIISQLDRSTVCMYVHYSEVPLYNITA